MANATNALRGAALGVAAPRRRDAGRRTALRTRVERAFGLATIGALGPLSPLGCAGQQSALDPAGRTASRIAGLFWGTTAGVAILWLAFVGLTLYATGASALVMGPLCAGLDPTAQGYAATVWLLVIWTALHAAVGVIMHLSRRRLGRHPQQGELWSLGDHRVVPAVRKAPVHRHAHPRR